MVAALTRIFGMHNLALAEDVVQDALCRAVEVWKFQGVPENPGAWLMTAAKNRALDVIRRERTARTFAPELGRLLDSEWTLAPVVEDLFRDSTIRDDELRMMFSCCNPRVPEEAQIALVLHISSGFGMSEIAAAFLSSEAAIQKRVERAKRVLATSRSLFDLRDADFGARLSAVLRALYLLFNEGYHGASAEGSVRVPLCHEAMRLGALLLEHPLTATPEAHALAALMHLHAARLPGRLGPSGELTPLLDQDRTRWDADLLATGQRLLDLSATGSEVTEYHVEAAIASVHALARSLDETDWGRIVGLYDTLLGIRPSPVVALNRAIAVGEHEGPDRGLEELHAIDGRERLDKYPFYQAALAELELRKGRHGIAREHFEAALGLARNAMERRFFEQRVSACREEPGRVDKVGTKVNHDPREPPGKPEAR
jgi:RNA polymerase sigma-70 factor (ECF subfamily)